MIIEQNSYLVRPWKEIFEERGLDCRNFRDRVLGIDERIEKKRFMLLPTFFQSEFEYKDVAETFSTLSRLNITAFSNIENLINLCMKKTLRPSNIPSFLYLDNIHQIKWKYRSWTITICDKNSNLQLPMCPKQYWYDMKRTFTENPNMFKIIINNQMQIKNCGKNYLQNLAKIHSKQWSHLGKLNKSGELPDSVYFT